MRSSLQVSTKSLPIPPDENFGLIGSSTAMERLRLQIHRIGPHFRSVLLTGETGTGKDLVTRALHTLGPGSNTPLIVCDAAAMAENLSMTGLFTHGGTLFLDEVSEMPLRRQETLLRILQQQENRFSGTSRRASLRIVAATHRNLSSHVQAGSFRRDLYERLSMIEIQLPPLRAHLEDLEELAVYFVNRFARQNGKPVPGLSSSVLARLLSHSWPGNVPEFANVLEHAVMHCAENSIELADLPPHLLVKEAPSARAFPAHIPSEEPQRLEDVVRHHVTYVLEQCGGNKLRTAERLGISRSTLYRLLENSASL
jgi:DNA-binding NtrC family response regulator